MAKLTIRRGEQVTHVAFDGTPRLTELLDAHGLKMTTPCGGRGVCGKCKVQATGALCEPGAQERACLAPSEIASGTRLACQLRLCGDAVVTLSADADFINIQLEGALPVFPRQPMRGQYGLAVDIGTTTLALRLVDLQRQAPRKAATAANPQGTIAADVIGRMEAALAGEGKRLQTLLTEGIDALIQTLCADCGIAPRDIGPIVMAGNTTMLYLLQNRDPAALSRAPFEADCLFGFWTDAASLCLHAAADARVFLPACVGAFVGADIVCGVLACGMHKQDRTTMLVDLGTNGEIALWHESTLYTCATAAGPAFEGVNISQGVGSVPGAIDSVWVQDGQLAYTTLGNTAPVGICGSGLIDAVAALLSLGLVDETGLMEEGDARIGGKVGLTQKDIRSVQLAKGAIAAGIQTLCEHVGIAVDQIETLYIAGGFGSHISITNAAAIGLIPAQLKGRAAVLGNASLTGAVMLLLQETYVLTTADIAKNAVSVPLGGSAAFAEHYMNCMLFASTDE